MKITNDVIIVDPNNKQLGVYDKIRAHQEGLLHRAFSIFIFNHKNETLLQKRALQKYHSGGLWGNTVCSHPKPDEDILKSIERRMIEEVGFSTNVSEVFSFIYKSEYENNMTEHEFDHVFVGSYDKNPNLNPSEASDYRWVNIDYLKSDLLKSPEKYTSWLKIIFENEEYLEKITNYQSKVV